MAYTLFSVSLYIIMRGLQVLLEDRADKAWAKLLIKSVTIVMLYAAFASLVSYYYEDIYLLGFSSK